METRDIKWLAAMAVLFIIGMSVAAMLSGCSTTRRGSEPSLVKALWHAHKQGVIR